MDPRIIRIIHSLARRIVLLFRAPVFFLYAERFTCRSGLQKSRLKLAVFWAWLLETVPKTKVRATTTSDPCIHAGRFTIPALAREVHRSPKKRFQPTAHLLPLPSEEAKGGERKRPLPRGGEETLCRLAVSQSVSRSSWRDVLCSGNFAVLWKCPHEHECSRPARDARGELTFILDLSMWVSVDEAEEASSTSIGSEERAAGIVATMQKWFGRLGVSRSATRSCGSALPQLSRADEGRTPPPI